MTFRVIKAKGRILEGDPFVYGTGIYMSMMCSICEEFIDDNKKVLESVGNKHKISIVCEDCAYAIHSAYEANL